MKKIYGQSKNESCPFCGKQAISMNKQGIPVCLEHKEEYLDLKCVCGEWLEIKKGKYGPFCICLNCGTINFNKALEANRDSLNKNKENSKKQTQITNNKNFGKKDKPLVVSSDEIDFLY